MLPDVSVIIPAYNVAECISRAVGSALAQIEVSVEVIVVDDASADGTADFVENAFMNEPRVKLIRRSVNGGPGAARNDGFRASNAEWLALLDGDDWWRPGRLKTMLERGRNYDFVADNIMGFDLGHSCEVEPVFPMTEDRELVLLDFIKPSSAESHDYGYLQPVFRRSFIEKNGIYYDEDVRVGEDLLFNLNFMVAGGRALLLHEALYVYALPVGPISRQASPYSRTEPDSNKLADAIAAFRIKNSTRLIAPELAAISRRLETLDQEAPISAFHLAKARKQYLKMFYLALTNWRVQKRIFKTLAGKNSLAGGVCLICIYELMDIFNQANCASALFA